MTPAVPSLGPLPDSGDSTVVTPEFLIAWEQDRERVALERLVPALAIFIAGLGLGNIFEALGHPARAPTMLVFYGTEMVICLATTWLVRLPAFAGHARVTTVVVFVAMGLGLSGYNGLTGASADRLAVVQVSLLSGAAAFLAPWARGQAWLAILVTASVVLALPFMHAADGRAFPVIGVAVGGVATWAAALLLESSRRRAFLRTLQLSEEAEIAAALLRIAQTLDANLDRPNMLEVLSRVVVDVVGCETSGTFLIPDEPDSPEEHPNHAPRIALDGAAQATLARGELLVLDYGRTLAAPIRREGRLLGAATFSWRHQQALFASRERRLAEGIAHLVAIANHNAGLLEDAQAASRLKSEFVATMSHELRTPLNVILGYIDLLIDGDVGPLATEQSNILLRTRHSALVLLDLVMQTLDLNRLDSGREPLHPETFTIADLLSEVVHELEALVPEGVVLQVSDHTRGRDVFSDRGKLKTILRNLVGNALKFTKSGTVTLRAATSGDGLVLLVQDTGSGIAADELPGIFEKFRQTNNKADHGLGGFGLGLYIVRRLLDLLGGDISAESTPGVGSCFSVRVPGCLVEVA